LQKDFQKKTAGIILHKWWIIQTQREIQILIKYDGFLGDGSEMSKQFEYRIFTYKLTSSIQNMEQSLDAFGKLGYELIFVTESDEYRTFYLKKEKSNER
jgi:hypothetical protein